MRLMKLQRKENTLTFLIKVWGTLLYAEDSEKHNFQKSRKKLDL